MKYDLHLEWFRQRLSKLFAIPELEYVDVLINDNYDTLKRFFEEDFKASSHQKPPDHRHQPTNSDAAEGGEEGQCQGAHLLYVYRTFYDRLVEKEIMVLEEVPHVQPSEPEPTKEKRKKGKGAAGGNKEKRANRGDLKDEDAEVKLDRDFLLDGSGTGNGDNAPATAAGKSGRQRKEEGNVIRILLFSAFV